MSVVTNPVLRGFNPDPCLCKGKDAWYMAVSTFEWYPGVLIYESKDFVNWNLKKIPLDRLSQLNLTGAQPSGGIWAPALTYYNGTYYLMYTDTKIWKSEKGMMPLRDMHNYLVTAPDIDGPWSEPVKMVSGGYDPSLFCDDDGRKYMVYIRRDFRQIKEDLFEGIVVQEYCEKTKQLIGKEVVVYLGSNVEIEFYIKKQIYEGPHIQKKDGWYYLITAEGGPGPTHCTCVSRSKNVFGPYESHPLTPMLSARHTDGEIQKCGHGNFVEGPDGQWYMSYLCGRPIKEVKMSPLGRESGITPIEWRDNWPYVAGGGIVPPREFSVKSDEVYNMNNSFAYDFTKLKSLPIELQALRIPITPDWCSMDGNGLTLVGKETAYSRYNQSLLGARIRHFEHEFATAVEISPPTFHQAAGLMLRYDEETWYFIMVTALDGGARGICYMEMVQGKFRYEYKKAELPMQGLVHLKAVTKAGKIRFYYSIDAAKWTDIGEESNFNMLCDECALPVGFTGSFGCVYAMDLLGRGTKATFKYFNYTETH